MSDDYSQFADVERVTAWADHDDLLGEALGQAVALREHLYAGGGVDEAQDRIRILVDVLTAMRDR